MVIEIMRFRLALHADSLAFEAADRRVQIEFAYQQPGLLRRTVARAADGEWVAIDLWRSSQEAERGAEAWELDPVAADFMSFVDVDSVSVDRYETLD
ncbi:MAG: hypothetical protein ACRDYE_06830 [Acidimicrobiales bacterium]